MLKNHRMICPLRLRRALLTVCYAMMAVAVGGRAAADTTPARNDAEADQAEFGSDWVRLERGASGEVLGMQTAIVRYAAADSEAGQPPLEVDLIGAVHIGDVAYYRQLNEHFKQYDALLYELVAPEGTVVQPGQGNSNTHPVGFLQNAIKRFLELDHQLEQIDYTPANFVHADMTPDEFLQSMRDRNESFLQMYFRLMGEAMAHQNQVAAKGESLDFELFSALFASDRPRRLKIALAKQLAEMESFMVSLGGEQGTVIISERNKKALDVLQRELDAGKKRLGVFYGAGHLNDMDERLREDFGLQPVAVTWLTAWNLAAQR